MLRFPALKRRGLPDRWLRFPALKRRGLPDRCSISTHTAVVSLALWVDSFDISRSEAAATD